mmetsp:Transcript_88013/g.234027  ORF Transcript_88013/g.234027 Transcript_88013/m.234027 type:complete len:193 (+) Transcript_88013:2-580(+)
MSNAFLILFIITSIYAILGVSLFADDSYQDFGRFSHAFYTMFYFTYANEWPDGVNMHLADGSPDWRVGMFSMSYVVIVGWVVLQVSVAVLLDSFVTSTAEIEENEMAAQRIEAKRKHQVKNPLEPLLRQLSRSYVDDVDLTDKLRRLFKLLDRDETGRLSGEEFCVALKKLVGPTRRFRAAAWRPPTRCPPS